MLVQSYFDNIYQASLLLSRPRFIQSLAAGAVREHIVLSICAWGANFYRDGDNQATYREDGSMLAWAKRAGKLVFEEAEELHEENVVTFFNLSLFWHSQGSWRMSKALILKANAYQLLRINGAGFAVPSHSTAFEIETRRRRLWTCYLMHCYSPERLEIFEPVADMEGIPLPWPEEDFDAGFSTCTRTTVKSVRGNGGIFSELVKGMTFWSKVVSTIKAPEPLSSGRLASIYALDENISGWWHSVRPDFKLTPTNLKGVPSSALPKILLANIVYHQSICALHASIVPLFSWGTSDGDWSGARQFSAQTAFEHACTVSTLLDAILSGYPRLSAMPSFVAFVAYSGCAVQIPFMGCSNLAFLTLPMSFAFTDAFIVQQIHVRCLFNAHQKNPIVLEDEPKYSDPIKLFGPKTTASHARASILEFTGVLRSKGDGYVKPGDEPQDLGISVDGASDGMESDLMMPRIERETSVSSLSQDVTSGINLETQSQEQTWLQQHVIGGPSNGLIAPDRENARGENLLLDQFNSFVDPDLLNFFPDGALPDLSDFDPNLLSLEYLETDDSIADDTTVKPAEDFDPPAALFNGIERRGEVMTIIIHHLQVSQSERIPWLCEELGIDYELKIYQRAPLLAPPEYKALHHMGAAPVIQDGDLTLAEICACIEYICHKHGDGRLFLDVTHPDYAAFLYWWHWADGSFQPAVGRLMSAQSDGQSGHNIMLEIARDRFRKALQMLDERLRDKEWLAGSEFTAADIMVVFSLTTMRYYSSYSLKEYENILEYLQRISKRGAYQKAMKRSDPTMELVLGPEPPK
ncbi:hypothetical protein G7046_g3107 [Stylonectria norvegica]|nr:hypothetical protein G7046_g3107 [Stylonectria norvegica]